MASEKEPSDQSAAVIEDIVESNKNMNYSINVPNDNKFHHEATEEDIVDSDDEKIVPLIKPLTTNKK